MKIAASGFFTALEKKKHSLITEVQSRRLLKSMPPLYPYGLYIIYQLAPALLSYFSHGFIKYYI